MAHPKFLQQSTTEQSRVGWAHLELQEASGGWDRPTRAPRPIRLAMLFLLTISTTTLHAADEPASQPDHPIIPAFERFYNDPDNESVTAGQLLLGELNCTSCHKIPGEAPINIIPKQAPILDNIGKRVRIDYLRKFIADPHAVKPGSTMPALFAHAMRSPASQRSRASSEVEALVHFLAATGTVTEEPPNPQFVSRGNALFHRVGCVACHAPRNLKENQKPPTNSVPLGDLTAKYTIPSLTQFLQNPHQVRPSGRMPALNLKGNEAKDIASYLLQDITFARKKPNIRFAAYQGNWGEIPDFSKLKPYKTGTAAAFDLFAAARTSNFGMRFEGTLHVPRDGNYTFHLGSDDGSQLFIDDKRIVDNNGVHPHTVRTGAAKLTPGTHAIRVDYIQGGGEWTLELQWEGPGVPRQEAHASISTDKNTPPPSQAKTRDDGEKPFVLNADLVKQGRELFAKIGCASCHQMKANNQPIKSTLAAKPLDKLNPASGCLAEKPADGIPHFSLSSRQRETLVAAVTSAPEKPIEDEERIARTFASFNCYACHQRNEIGGVPRNRNALFQGTIPEMGDEGRIPPHLNGVGDKLKLAWLKHVLDNGADDRPYMQTRMPRFGKANVGHLANAFAKLDAKTEVEIPEPVLPTLRTKATGRFLVGDKALSCIKCHNFGPHKSTGIQSMDLQTMTRRLRRDWYHRYMMKPFRYRPGTRMPTGFPGGRAVVRGVLEGSPPQQLIAIWEYLADGTNAPVPLGLLKQAIVLKPEKEPIIYRNFLEGLSPRGIAVGYPEQTHLAFDAQSLDLALIWKGAFIDASKHWVGRGPGNQRPLGDLVVSLVRGLPLAVLESGEAPWPNKAAEQLGVSFRGYRLDKQRRPIFRYGSTAIEVEDVTQPVTGETATGFKRTLTITAKQPVENLWYRAAANQKIQQLEEGWYLIGDVLKIRVKSGTSQPVLRKAGNQSELLIPVPINGKPTTITHEYSW